MLVKPSTTTKPRARSPVSRKKRGGAAAPKRTEKVVTAPTTPKHSRADEEARLASILMDDNNIASDDGALAGPVEAVRYYCSLWDTNKGRAVEIARRVADARLDFSRILHRAALAMQGEKVTSGYSGEKSYLRAAARAAARTKTVALVFLCTRLLDEAVRVCVVCGAAIQDTDWACGDGACTVGVHAVCGSGACPVHPTTPTRKRARQKRTPRAVAGLATAMDGAKGCGGLRSKRHRRNS